MASSAPASSFSPVNTSKKPTHGLGREMLTRRHLHGAHDDEPSGRPEEPADHRIGNKTYRPACMRNAKDKQHRSSEGGTERHDDDRTLQEMFGRALGDNPLEECGDERGHDGRGRAVGPGDCKWQRTAQPDDQARNRGGEERDRNPVAEPLCEGAGENQRRVGKGIRDG